MADAHIRTNFDHVAVQLRRSDPRESQRSDLAESLKMRVWRHLVSTLHPGLCDATVVSRRYITFFMRRNKPDGVYIYVNNQ
jgi:predicted ABC-type ATPase